MFKVGEAWHDGKKLGRVLLVRMGTAWLTLPTAVAFLRMQIAAWEGAGLLLTVNSGFRTWAEQARLRADYLAGRRQAVAAAPGRSNHQTGWALDIESAAGTNKAFRWLTARAGEFGFRRTVQSEPWHWEHRPAEVSA